MYTESYADLSWIPSANAIEFSTSHFHEGDATHIRCRKNTTEILMSDPRVAALRLRPRSRRADWHNPWLWNCIETSVVSPPRSPESCVIPSELALDSSDVLRLAKQRTGQQRFRAALLSSQENKCAICGIREPEVLEAAHLTPHAEGGSYEISNGRLLCANHHRAFDAGLYRYDASADSFIWASIDPEPMLGGTLLHREGRSR
jgi:hypothetical protein